MVQSLSLLAALSLLAITKAAPQGKQNGTAPGTRSKIQWFPCSTTHQLPYTCGTLAVPLDYTDLASQRTLNLSLVRVRANNQPFKGSILLNPGGPGAIGRDFFSGGSDQTYLDYTGGHYDLISFDPRGTGNTIPFNCFATDEARQSDSTAQTLNPGSTNASDTAVGTIWAVNEYSARNCYQQEKLTGSLIGTAFVARDMMQIVDALGEDGLLRYWGFSYGTILGATVAAMFPDRMDKVVLDGVANPHDYWSGRDVETVTTTDAAFRAFVKGCAAAPEHCAVARKGKTADALYQQIIDLLDIAKQAPIVLGSTIDDVVTYGQIKNTIFTNLYFPIERWPRLGRYLNAVITKNQTAYRTYDKGLEAESSSLSTGLEHNRKASEDFPNKGDDALAGIACGDSSLRTDNLLTMLTIVDELESLSTFGGDTYAVQVLLCAQWKMTAKERYRGNFSVTTKHPMLVVGNIHDPVTPLKSAMNVSTGFAGSVLLQHNGEGHCSTAHPSKCTSNAILKYWLDGTLPAPGTQCEPDEPVFGPSNSTTPAGAPSRLRRRSDIVW